MKLKIALLMLGLVVLAGCFSASRISEMPITQAAQDKRLIVGIVDFQNKSGNPEFDAASASCTGILLNELQKSKKFRLVERNRFEAILNELKLNMSGLVDPKTAKEVGAQLGIDALLFGDLVSIKYDHSKSTIGIMYTEVDKVEALLDARLVRVDTGELLATAQVPAYVKNRRWVAFWFAKLGKTLDKKSVVQKCIEIATKQIAINIASQSQDKQ